MKSQILHPSPFSSGEENQSDSFINVILKAKQVNIILPFLIAHEIPFTLSSAVPDVETNDLPEEEISKDGYGLSYVKGQRSYVQQLKKPIDIKKNNALENIFRKYIINGIESIPPKIEEIAAEAGLSLSQFKALFKKRYGKPFYQMYIEHKMAYAAKLLQEGHTSMVVSERIGYVHPIKFNKMFQKYFGMTPYKYQKMSVVTADSD